MALTLSERRTGTIYTQSELGPTRLPTELRRRDSVTSNPKLDLNPAVGRRAHW